MTRMHRIAGATGDGPHQLSIANGQLLIVNESLPILARGAEFVFRIAYCVRS